MPALQSPPKHVQIHHCEGSCTNVSSSNSAPASSPAARGGSTARTWSRSSGSAPRSAAEGCEVIVVTSGAIAAGRERLDHPTLPPTVAAKQMLAAVGQSWLMHVWESLFDLYGLHVGQMLLTRADVADRDRFLNARDMLVALLEHGIMPIINENDAVATAEIKVGDNDNLSALIALLAEADLLLLLTDQPGLFTADPRTDPDAQLIPEVDTIDETLRMIAGGSVSGLGVGGMAPSCRRRTWPAAPAPMS